MGEAADLFRGVPVVPDLFAEPLPYSPTYLDGSARPEGGCRTPPFLRAVFDVTVAARAVASALFLHAWSAFHLDPDTTVLPLHWSDADYRIDADESAVLDVFERAAAPRARGPLFTEALRVAAQRMVC